MPHFVDSRLGRTPQPKSPTYDLGKGGQRPLGNPGIFVLLVGVLLPQIDYFIVNVALTAISRSLGASAAVLALIVVGYGTVYATLLVLGGRLGDALGRRTLFFIGLAGFTGSSLACGLSSTPYELLAFRLVQGAFAAALVPQVVATFHATLTGQRRHRAQSLYGAAAGAAIAIGQLVGGLLVTANIAGAGWRLIFLVNVPIGMACLAAVPRFIPQTRAAHPRPVDIPGTVLFAGTLAALLLPLGLGQSDGWPPWCWITLAAVPGLATTAVIVERRVERRGGAALLPPSLFALRSVRRGLALHLPFMLSYGGFMFAFSLTLQQGLGADPWRAGLTISPMAAAFFVVSLAVPSVVARAGSRATTACGGVLLAVGLAGLAAIVSSTWPTVPLLAMALALTVMGAGQGLVFGSLFRLVLSDVPDHIAGAASGLLVTTQQAGLALGVATLGGAFLALRIRDPATAFVVVTAAGAVIAVLIAVGSRGMPIPLPSVTHGNPVQTWGATGRLSSQTESEMT